MKIATYDYKHGWHLVNEGYAVFHLYGHEGPLPPTFGRTREEAHGAYQRNHPDHDEHYGSDEVETVEAVQLEDTSIDYPTRVGRFLILTAQEWEAVRAGERSIESIFSDSRWIE